MNPPRRAAGLRAEAVAGVSMLAGIGSIGDRSGTADPPNFSIFAATFVPLSFVLHVSFSG